MSQIAFRNSDGAWAARGFRLVSSCISETVQDRATVIIER